jgi:branched-chain amino acid transport system permease protein
VVDYFVTVATGVSLFGILALGMNIQWGWAGLLNLSYVAFIAIGAYTSAFVTLPPPSTPTAPYLFGLGMPFVVAAAAGMLAAGLVGLILGWIALRQLRTDYFAIVTLCFFTIFYQFVGTFRPLANGWNGVFGIPRPFESALGPLAAQYYNDFYLGLCLVVLAAVYFFCQRLQRSPFGRTLRAVREDQTAAMVFGRDPFTFKLRAFVIGAMIAGLGGALTAHWVGAYAPASWSAAETFLILACVLLGGTANNRGAILGAVLIAGVMTEAVGAIPNLFPGLPISQSALEELRLAVFGLLMLAVIRWRPRGVLPETWERDPARAISPAASQ